jgi:hypothetical protein
MWNAIAPHFKTFSQLHNSITERQTPCLPDPIPEILVVSIHRHCIAAPEGHIASMNFPTLIAPAYIHA